jgi:hypothetical protein
MSAVQFNLLPDVKLHYVKAQRIRNLVMTIALLIGGISLAIFLLTLFTADVVQKKQLSDANGQIASATNQLKQVPDLQKVLTVQNQLTTLSGLHKNKHVSSRIFTYLPQITPTNVKISNLSADFSTNTLLITGSANTQHSVNTFIDTLKFTTFKVGDQGNANKAFTSVVESSFSVASGNASYSLTLHFDPQLFSNNLTQAPQLTVPQLTTTRSALDDPNNNLFNDTGGTQ